MWAYMCKGDFAAPTKERYSSFRCGSTTPTTRQKTNTLGNSRDASESKNWTLVLKLPSTAFAASCRRLVTRLPNTPMLSARRKEGLPFYIGRDKPNPTCGDLVRFLGLLGLESF